MLTLECGGTAFTIDEASNDATSDTSTGDASGDVAEAADDVSSDAPNPVEDAAMDAGSADADDADEVHDARDADLHDARDADAHPPFDAAEEEGGDAAEEEGGDAATPHCSDGFACAPAVPAGWTGPVELSAGAIAPPACGANFAGPTLSGSAGLTAQPATCGCSCATAPGMPCPPAIVDFYASSLSCSTVGAAPCATTVLSPGLCTTVDALATCDAGVAGVVMSVPASAPLPSTCTPLPKVFVPISTWATSAHACTASVAPAPADCPAGNVCAPAPAAPFLTSLCVEQAGDVPCPSPDSSAGYSVKHLYYGSVDDLRGCSACSCASVSGPSCSVTVNQFASTDGGCSGMPVSYGAGRCLPVQQPADLQLALTASLASCAATLTTPTGAATPTRPMTFCCTP